MGACNSNKEVTLKEKEFYEKIDNFNSLLLKEKEGEVLKGNAEEKFQFSVDYATYSLLNKEIKQKKDSLYIKNDEEKSNQIILTVNNHNDLSYAKISGNVLLNTEEKLSELIDESNSNYNFHHEGENKKNNRLFFLKNDESKTDKDKDREGKESKMKVNPFSSLNFNEYTCFLKDDLIIEITKNQSTIKNGGFKVNYDISNFQTKNPQEFSTNYEIKDKLGKGSFGIVYSCINKKIYDERVIKKIKMDTTDLESMLSGKNIEIFNEINILKKLNHSYILKLYEFYFETSAIFIVTEACKEGELFKNQQKMNSFQACSVMYQLFHGINFYHQRNIVHRDLKPENILIKNMDEHGLFHIRIIDFGIAKVLKDPITNPRKEISSVAGSLNYMAPEIFSGNGYSYECDLWSCGVIMFQIMTGVLPFNGDNEKEVTEKIKEGKFNKKLLDGLTSTEKDLINSLLETNPKKRITARKAIEHSWFKSFQIEESLYSISDDFMYSVLNNLMQFAINVQSKNFSKFYIFCLLYITSNLPRENKEVDYIFRLYTKLNKNHSDFIDLSLFSNFFKTTILNFNKFTENKKLDGNQINTIIKEVFNCIDLKKEGSLCFSNFIAVCISSSSIFHQKYYELVFQYLDKTNSARISHLDLINSLNGEDLDYPSMVKDKELNNAFTVSITNESFTRLTGMKLKNPDFISKTEFISFMEKNKKFY